MHWAVRAGSALLVSAFAHAMAALTVGIVVRSMSQDAAREPDVLDVDVVSPVDSPAHEPQPATVTLHRTSKEPTLRRFVSTRRREARLAHGTEGLSGAPSVSSPLATDSPARFILGAGTVATRPGATTALASGPLRNGGPEGAGTFTERYVNVAAHLVWSSPLVYPPVARQAEIEIDFPVEIVVDTDGRVVAARAISRFGYGLDEAVLRAIREYRFSPALRAGRPVRVRMPWTVQFRLR